MTEPGIQKIKNQKRVQKYNVGSFHNRLYTVDQVPVTYPTQFSSNTFALLDIYKYVIFHAVKRVIHQSFFALQ